MRNIAKQAGIALFWGCNDESISNYYCRVARSICLCPHTRYIDLDGSLDLAEDIVKGGFELKNGYMMPVK